LLRGRRKRGCDGQGRQRKGDETAHMGILPQARG
jgi:hypothetical protein